MSASLSELRQELCETASFFSSQRLARCLNKGIDINIPDASGETAGNLALTGAVRNGNLENIDLLVMRGVIINSDPLIAAASKDRSKVVDFLLKNKAQIDG